MSPYRIVLSILLIILAAPMLHAQDKTYLLEGTIGKYPIVMKVHISGAECEARYFYTSSLQDIALTGPVKKNKLYLTDGPKGYEHDFEVDAMDTTETLKITMNAPIFTGTWVNKERKRLPITLHTIHIDSVKSPAIRFHDTNTMRKELTYDYVRFAYMKLVQDSVVKQGKYALQYVHIANTDISTFRISEGYSKPVTDKINDMLILKLIRNAQQQFECPSYSVSYTGPFLNDDVLFFCTHVSLFCSGMPHPQAFSNATNIFVATGKEIAQNDLLYFGPAKRSKEQRAARLVKILKQCHPQEMTKDFDDHCDYTDPELWQSAEWTLTSKGMQFFPDFSHAQTACEEPDWSFIPFSVLKKYRNPKAGIRLPAH